MHHKVITIGIPTYNRAAYLDRCLGEVLKQAEEFSDLINIQISDNASTDDTKLVVGKYQASGYEIDYVRHDENVGMDRNFYSLYQRCSTKYMWMLSDDDFLMQGGLKKIMTLLSSNDCGVVYLNNVWFNEETEILDVVHDDNLKFTRYGNPLDFVNRVNYWFTFISGNIVNKSIVDGKINFTEFDGTFLMLLGWIIPAAFQGAPNYVIDDTILACKANNTGGYKLFKVFGENFNNVMDGLIRQGCDPRMKKIINTHLLRSFFPMFLDKQNEKFAKEKYMSSMVPVFWKYKLFWTNIFPSLLRQQLHIV